jgi:gamma-glutamyltranspeptidase/glutathione hydrolase
VRRARGAGRAAPTPEPPLAGKRVEARRGVVVTSATDASAAGLAMLEAGGNAVDAAVAAAFALAVVDPSQTGLGGYGVGVVWMRGRAEVVEAMGQAGADPAWGQPDPAPAGTSAGTSPSPAAGAGGAPAAPAPPNAAPAPTAGGAAPERPAAVFDGGDARAPRTALVPGFVAGLLALHERHGRLARAAVLAPARRLARDGFVVGPLNHRLIAASRDKLLADTAAAAVFLPGGEPPRVGDRLVQPQLAALLDAVAERGAPAFYASDFARRAAAKTRLVGGLLDAADFAAYQPAFRRPVCSTFAGYTVLGAPAPVSGPTIAEFLALSERAGLAALGDPTHAPAAAVGLADALRVAVADRRLYAGHPEWAATPVRGVASAGFAAARSALVGAAARDSVPRGDAWAFEPAPPTPACAALDPYPVTVRPAAVVPPPAASPAAPPVPAAPAADADPSAQSNTSHLVVVDADRNAVSLTTSVGVLFGSGVYADGVFLNSSGNLFARGERAPRRRPGSGLTPTLLLDARGRVRLAAGAGGAAYIPTAVGQVVYRIAGLGQDPWAALAAPRLHPVAAGRALEVEQGLALGAYGALRAHGYLPVNRVATLQFAGVHAAWVGGDGRLVGVADPRRDGAAAGY